MLRESQEGTTEMPIYEYNCPTCGDVFEKLVFGSDEVLCPKCGGEVNRLMSACSFTSTSGTGEVKTSAGSSGCSTCSATSCATCH
jgi:putative FmdB family regulatory protein